MGQRRYRLRRPSLPAVNPYVWGLLLAWMALTVLLAIGAARWFQILHAKVHPPTPWEPSVYDPDVEVRWRDGQVESRLRDPQVHAHGR